MNNIMLPREDKQEIIARIQEYFYLEFNEEIGNLAAGNLLEFIIEEISPFIYNKAIDDANTIIQQKMVSIEEDLYAMKKQTKLLKRRK